MERPFNESAWRRGWNDTKSVWTSWPFYVLDAVVAVVIGGLFGWYWGLVVVVSGMICVWMGVTASASIRQRNEARALLQKRKTVPLPNRDALIRAIGTVRQKTLEVMNKQEELDRINKRSPYMADINVIGARDKAYNEFRQAMSELENEKLVAGEAYKDVISNLTTFVWFHVYCNLQKPVQIGGDKPIALTGLEFVGRLADKVDKAIREINEING